ncbi:hypothetical protein QEN19_000954 [Hanseniaspora menglaensis]
MSSVLPSNDITLATDEDFTFTDLKSERDDKRVVMTDTNDNTGIYFLLVAQFLNTVMTLATKLLLTDHLKQKQKTGSEDTQEQIHPFEILFFRMAFTLIFSFIYTRRNNITIFFKESGFPIVKLLLCARGVFGFFGVFGLYSSLKYISISDAISITFLAPLFTSVFAYMFLKEKYYQIEAYFSICALIGVLLITRPSFFSSSESNDSSVESPSEGIVEGNARQRVIGTFYALLSMVGSSSIYIIIKKIGSRADAILSVTYFSIIVCIISFFGITLSQSLHFKMPSSFYQWVLFLIIGVSGFVMQYTLTVGIQREKRTSRSSLIIYTQLIYGIIWEIIFFDHFPDLLSTIGMVIILCCTLAATINKQKKNYSKDTNKISNPFLDESNNVEVTFELNDLEDTVTDNSTARV